MPVWLGVEGVEGCAPLPPLLSVYSSPLWEVVAYSQKEQPTSSTTVQRPVGFMRLPCSTACPLTGLLQSGIPRETQFGQPQRGACRTGNLEAPKKQSLVVFSLFFSRLTTTQRFASLALSPAIFKMEAGMRKGAYAQRPRAAPVSPSQFPPKPMWQLGSKNPRFVLEVPSFLQCGNRWRSPRHLPPAFRVCCQGCTSRLRRFLEMRQVRAFSRVRKNDLIRREFLPNGLFRPTQTRHTGSFFLRIGLHPT